MLRKRESSWLGGESLQPWQYAFRVFRDDMGWSREKLAKFIDVSSRSIAYWEEGREPGLRAQAKLVMALEELPLKIEREVKRLSARYFPETKFLSSNEIIAILERKGFVKEIKKVLVKEIPKLKDLSFKETLAEYIKKKPNISDGMMKNIESEKYIKLQRVYSSLKNNKKINPRKKFTPQKTLPQKKSNSTPKNRSGSKARDSDCGNEEGCGESESEPPGGGKNSEWLDVKGFSTHYNVKPATIYFWTERKLIPHYRFGKLVRFKKREIDQWAERRKVEPLKGNFIPTFFDNRRKGFSGESRSGRKSKKEVNNGHLPKKR